MSDNKIDIAAMEARAIAASPGPWRSLRHGNQYVHTRYLPTAYLAGVSQIEGLAFAQLDLADRVILPNEDADFIAHARIDVSALIAYVRELKAAVAYAASMVESEFQTEANPNPAADLRALLARSEPPLLTPETFREAVAAIAADSGLDDGEGR